MMKSFLMVGIIMGALSVFAHEGHDNAPGALKANHGGVVKAGKEINLEYVVAGNLVKIYPATHEGAEVATSDVKVSATLKAPKGKAEEAKIDLQDGAYVTTVDFKNAYRVEMTVTVEIKNKKNIFKFQVEK